MSDFTLLVRRDPGYELRVSVRFTVRQGAGILSLPQRGRPDAPQSQRLEELDIAPDALRGGRFIHLLQDTGRRQSYALSRLTADKLASLPEGEWIELEATTEFGFRYAVLPASATQGESKSAAVVAVAVPSAKAAVSIPPTSRAPRPAPVASASASGEVLPAAAPAPAPAPAPVVESPPPDRELRRAADATSGTPTLPPRPLPMEPELARAAISALPREALEAALEQETSLVAELHQRIQDLERQLERSIAQKADLLELLGRWQSS